MKKQRKSDPYRQFVSDKRREQEWAYYLLNEAIKGKFIIRPKNCQMCGIQCSPHAHHHDYSKPYEVEWLCDNCHYRKVHRMPILKYNTRRHKLGESYRSVFGDDE